MKRFFGILVLFGLLAVAPASAQEPPGRSLVVGTKVAPPFSMKDDAGEWTGISIDLWRTVAEDLSLDYRFEERDLDGLIRGLGDGTLDVSVAALTITAEREKVVDMTAAYHVTGLGIAVPARAKKGWLAVVGRFFSLDFLKVLGLLLLLLLAAGTLVWVFERKRNPEQFAREIGKGLGDSFWWSAVTMTTVGYGDKSPASTGGRAVALVWMFTSVVVISSFTAAIASSLTVSNLESPVRGPADLPKVRVGTVPGSSSEGYLKARRIARRGYPTALDALRGLEAGEVDAVVYDAPLLKYLVATEVREGVAVLPVRFEEQGYGMALPEGSPLRERLNRALLKRTRESAWQDVLYRYLGESGSPK